MLQRACNDASWRVRHAMAGASASLVDACKRDGFAPELEQVVLRRFAFHLVDAEVGARVARVLRRLSAARAPQVEVQLAAVKLVAAVAEKAPGGFAKEVVPTLREFQDKLSMIDPKVVKVLSKQLMGLFPVLVVADAPVDELYKLVEECIGVDFGEGRERETFEVKLSVMDKLPAVVDSAPHLAPNVLQILRDNVENANWRVRRAVLRALPGVTKVVGDFEAELLAKYVAGFADPIARVREACAALVEQLREGWGVDWVRRLQRPSLPPPRASGRG